MSADLLLVVVAVAVAWLWYRHNRRTQAERALRAAQTAFFDSEQRDVMLHFPSMTFVRMSTAPRISWGTVERSDGPKWLLKLPNARGADAEETTNADFAAELETAYQQFLRASFDTSRMDRDWFLERMRQSTIARFGECHLEGVD